MNANWYHYLSKIVDDFDAYLIDMWGVVHDGEDLFTEAVHCLKNLVNDGKKVVLVTNSPRRVSVVEERLDILGLSHRLYHDVISSGEVVWNALHDRPDDWHQKLGDVGFFIGTDDDARLLEGLPQDFTAHIQKANFVLAGGLPPRTQDLDPYIPLLQSARSQGLPLLCANPDLEVVNGGIRQKCAGSLAEIYERLGGEVKYYGKPDPRIYNAAFEKIADTPKKRVLAIGDSLHTDLSGAHAMGLACVFITSGLHSEELGAQFPDDDRLRKLFKAYGVDPLAVMSHLAW